MRFDQTINGKPRIQTKCTGIKPLIYMSDIDESSYSRLILTSHHTSVS